MPRSLDVNVINRKTKKINRNKSAEINVNNLVFSIQNERTTSQIENSIAVNKEIAKMVGEKTFANQDRRMRANLKARKAGVKRKKFK
ncbi:MAG: hypothetical protein ACXABY_05375 [Candidatus Thorarchaeota archaeon]|jgi:hypothetical protein